VPLNVVTWNVNSIRARLAGLAKMCEALAPDIVLLQETKVMDEAFPEEAVWKLGFENVYVHGIKAYGGVAILSHFPLIDAGSREWCDRADGRHAYAKVDGGGELGEFEVHSLYVPSGGIEPDPISNPKFKHKLAFLDEFREWSASLDTENQKILVAGDFNVAPLETDVWSHRQLIHVVSHTAAEVLRLNNAMAAGPWVDAVRHFIPPQERLYSWWSYRAHDWQKVDRGRRLDHIWTSPPLAEYLTGAKVLKEARAWDKPSDHVPVGVSLKN
jgi:exodeoxyribonuclease III